MQRDLFGNSEDTGAHLKNGEEAVVGNWRVRNFNGYHQSKEGAGPWRFYVSGFGRVVEGRHVECSLLRIDGSTEVVPLDANGAISVLGRKYAYDRWAH